MNINKKKFFLNKLISDRKNLVDADKLSKIIALYQLILKTLKTKNSIFICGNGGSASIAEHVSCDLIKNFKFRGKKQIFSLTCNTALMTMISNDYGYDKVFSYQLEKFSKKNDLLILISSSGNSANIVNCYKMAKKINLNTFSLVGFSGGKLFRLSSKSNSIHVKSNDYGTIEDIHQSIFHLVISLSHQKF